jgi:hypothetical protein
MALSAFNDKQKMPEAEELAKVLGQAHTLWNELKERISTEHAPIIEEWTYSGKNYGWSLRLKQKKRAVVYLTPCEGYFRIGLAFGKKAVQAAQQSDLPAPVLKLIDEAPKYPEGRGVRMEVRSEEDIRIVEKLAAIKMAN